MKLLFEQSKPGRGSGPFAGNESLTPGSIDDLAPFLRSERADLPELAEIDIVRHYTALSRRNFGVDTGFYPLGSCTMKYNPKINEDLSQLPGFTELHPYVSDDFGQGSLRIIYELAAFLSEIFGLADFTLQPAAGAHGELTG